MYIPEYKIHICTLGKYPIDLSLSSIVIYLFRHRICKSPLVYLKYYVLFAVCSHIFMEICTPNLPPQDLVTLQGKCYTAVL